MQYRQLRCKNCHAMLGKAQSGIIQIKCRKCKVVNDFDF